MMKKLHECSWSFLRATKLVDRKPTRRFASKVANASNDRLDEACTMPEARGPPLLGMASWLISSAAGTKLHEYVDQKHKELGPVYRDCVGPVKAIFVNSPDEYRRIFRLEGPTPKHYLPEAFYAYNQMRNCKRGLLFMDGEEWLRFRRILNKILLVPDPAIVMAPSCQIIAELFANRLSDYARLNTVIPNLEDQLYQWSLEVLLAILVGPTTWNKNSDKLQNEAKKLSKILHNLFLYSVRLSSLPIKLAVKLNLPWWTKFVKCLDDAMDILKILIPELSQMEGDGILQSMISEGIQDDDLFRIVADLIIAAGDTTAYSMQWSLFLIGSHPKQQEKLYERVKDLNRHETLRDQLMKGVVKESLRLYPIAPFIARFLPEDSTLQGYKVCKDELIIMSLYSSSRDPANFVKPNEFIPERWIRTKTGDLQKVLTPNATLPFAMGGRSCIGRKLAETQLALTISELIKKYKLVCVNTDKVKLKLHLISVPSEPILISLSNR